MKKKQYSLLELVEIEWSDSRMFITQCEIDYNFNYEIIKSIGWVVKEDAKQLAICGDLVGEEVRRVIVIPKVNVIKVRII